MESIRKERKFEDAYCLTSKTLITINEAQHLYIANRELFESKYRSSFVCPECRKARLTYVSRESPHFRAYPNNKHDDNCSLQQEVMPPEKVSAYVDSIENESQIERQMNGLITMLLSAGKSSVSSTSHEPVSQGNDLQKARTAHNTTSTKYLPRKRIDTPFKDDDFGVYKLFYGIVFLKWRKSKSGKYGMVLSNSKNNSRLCVIWISEAVYKHIPEYYKTPGEYPCAISFLAVLKRDDNGALYSSLRRSQFLQIEKISLLSVSD